MNGELTGIWTFRGLRNRPGPVSAIEELLAGEGELTVDHAATHGTFVGQLAFRSSPPQATDPRLLLAGYTERDGRFRARGTGVKGTGPEGWVADYSGQIAPAWPEAIEQRPTLIGSVLRVAGHGAGSVLSFAAVRCDFLEPREIIPLPRAVAAMLASASHRLWHMAWHTVRGSWSLLRPAQQRDIHREGEAPGGPAKVEDARPALDRYGPVLTNGSGEDFLYMHRRMIAMVREMGGPSTPEAWASIPGPAALLAEPDPADPAPVFLPAGNPDGFAVPPAWHDPAGALDNHRIPALKGDEYFYARMSSWDREFKNPAYLATLSLGALGALIEFTVHNAMHMRWSSVPRDPETGEPSPLGRPRLETDGKWLLPAYDFLGEFFSSHVNPVFWRLHGWVDRRIDDWFDAHEALHCGEVIAAETGGVPWFAAGPWVRNSDPWPGPLDAHGGQMHLDEEAMRRVLRIIDRPESEDGPEGGQARPEAFAALVPSRGAARASLLWTFSRPWFPPS